jgi:hypothetical protein
MAFLLFLRRALVGSALVAGLASVAAASPGLFRHARLDFPEAGEGPAALGDLDGDGLLDAVVTRELSFYGDGINVLLGRGDGTFERGMHLLPDTRTEGLALGDIDGDGLLDLVAARYWDVAVYPGQGDGTFGPETVIPLDDSGYRFLAVHDLDRDGALDLITLRSFFQGGTVVVILGRGDGSFDPPTFYEAGFGASDLEIGDVDRDGAADLVVSNTADRNLSLLLGNGDGTFASGGIVDVLVEGGAGLGDVDGDGFLDLAVSGDQLYLLRGTGDGSFSEPEVLGESCSSPPAPFVGDLDGDGIADILLSCRPMALYHGMDGGTPVLSRTFPGTKRRQSMLADLDGNGYDDLVQARPTFSVYLNRESGLEDAGFFRTSEPSQGLVVGYFDGNGFPDLVTTTELGASVLLGNGDGTFGEATTWPGGGLARDVSTADYDGDGDADLALPLESGGFSVLLGNGDGTFADPLTQAAGESPRGIATADFDGDSVPDLVVRNLMRCWVYLGLGDGTFLHTATLSGGMGTRTAAVTIADLDEDTIPDVIVGYWGAWLAVHRGHGDGAFDPMRAYAVSGSPWQLAAADLDGDDRTEVVVVSINGIDILRSDGRGGLVPGEMYPGPPDRQLQAVGAGDLDGDGRPDLAVASTSRDLSVLLNRGPLAPAGSGFRITSPAYGLGESSYDLVIADLDGDGASDIATSGGNTVDHWIAVLLGRGGARPAGPAEEPAARRVRPRLGPPAPAPFRDATTIHFSLAGRGPARLAVFDVTGRRVRTLLDAPLAAGPHAVTWDGRDAAGRAVAAGVYFVRLERDGAVSVRKVVRTR